MPFEQGRTTTVSGVTSTTLAYTGAVKAGSLLVAATQEPNTTSETVSDNVNTGNWSVSDNHATGNTSNDAALFYKANTKAGTPTVSINGIGSGPFGVAIAEYSGVVTTSPLDVHNATDGNGTSLASGSLTTTGPAGDLLISTMGSATQNVTESNSTSGWTVDVNNSPNATMDIAIASKIQIPKGAFTTTWSVSGAAQDLTVLASSFKLAGTLGYSGIGPSLSKPPTVPGGFFQPFTPLVVVTTGGPVSNVVTATDNLDAMSDTTVRAAMSLLRTALDTLSAMSDIPIRVLNLPRTISDSLSGLSETLLRSLSLPRTVSDTLGAMSDTAVRAVLGFLRSATDNLSAISDSANRSLQSFLRTATDNLSSISDTASAIKAIFVTATDNLSAITDSAVRAVQGFSRTATDSFPGLSEIVSRIEALTRNISDNLPGISDTASAIKIIIRTATDNLTGMTDSAIRTFALTRTAIDNLNTLSDSAIRSAQSFFRHATESINSLIDSAINTGAIPEFFVYVKSFMRDGSLISKVRDGSLKIFGRDSSFTTKIRDGSLKVFGRDASKKNNTRG